MKHHAKRLFCGFLALVMAVSLAVPPVAFAAEADESLCRHHPEHTAECGYVAPTEGRPCNHEHTAECYTLGVLPEGNDAYTVSEDTGNLLDCKHAHDETCGYVPADPGHPCEYECHICPVQNLINALPDADTITAETAPDVQAQLAAIDDARAALTDEELDALDTARYEAAVSAILALEGMKGANVPELLATNYDVSTGDVVISANGDYTITGSTTSNTITVEAGVNANITLNNVSIDVSGNYGAAAFGIADNSTGNVTITLEGTNTLKSGSNCAGLQKSGGTGTLTITGTGSLTATGGSFGAGIGGGDSGSGTGITISGGTVTANGGASGAGIGGGYGYDGGGTITITGGTVTATGGHNGAGIGGGNNGNGGIIKISGGKVEATGSNSAGIGGGSSGAGGTITISAGEVTAKGGSSGAGIGGGWKGSGGDITISGGTVKANGDSDGYGAGIGNGGYGGTGGKVTISGGIVTATGGKYGAGIGNGSNGSSGCTFSTDTNGNAWIVASGGKSSTPAISDTSNQGTWNGIIFQNGAGQVYGNSYTLTANAEIPSGATLTVDSGKTLTIARGANITGDGTIGGEGTFQTENLMKDMISVPSNLVYNGNDRSEDIKTALRNLTATICGQAFQVTGWGEPSVTTTDNFNYTVTYTPTNGGETVAKTVTLGQSGTEFVGDGAAKAYKGDIEASEFTYGETITVKAKPTPTGEAPAMLTASLTAPASGQMALYFNDQQVSDAVAVDNENGQYTMTASVKDLIAAGAQYNQETTLTAKFVGTSLMADGAGTVNVTLKPATLTISGATLEAKTYDTTNSGTVTGVDFSGLVSGDTLALGTDYTATAEFADANAGENKNAIVTVTLNDTAAAKNYTLAGNTCSATGTINAKTVTATVTVNPTSYEYDGTAKEPAVTVMDGNTEIDPSEYTVEYSNNTNVGTSAIVTIKDADGGNYSVSGSITFEITQPSLTTAEVTLDQTNFTYDGTAKAPGVTVKKGSTTVDASEYAISYSNTNGGDGNNTNAGTVTVTVTAKTDGHYSGSNSANFTISQAALPEMTLSATSTTYTGTDQKPTVTIGSLTEGTDYDVAYTRGNADTTDFTNAGEIRIKATGKGNYTGTTEKTYTIAKATPVIAWSSTSQELTYTGHEAAITDPTVTLVNNEPFSGTISYSYEEGGKTVSGLPTNAGTYTIKASVAESGNYTAAESTNTLTLTINKSTPTIAFSDSYKPDKTYDGQTIANPTESDLTITGAAVKDVKFSWSATPLNVGTYTLTATIPETNNTASVSITKDVTISPKNVTSPTVELSPSSYVYDGTAKEPMVTVKDGETVIPSGEYTVEYSNNTNVGASATVTIKDKDGGNYVFTPVTANFTITAIPLTDAKVTVGGSYTYNGSAQQPTADNVTVTLGGKTLTEGTDYTLSYDENINAGLDAGTVIVTGQDNYTGRASGKFTIAKATLTVSGTGTASGDYGAKLSELTVSDLTAKLGEMVIDGTWKLTGDTVPNVGDNGKYTAIFTPTDSSKAGNYNPLTAEVTLSIAKVNYTGTTAVNASGKFGTTRTYDLSDLLPLGYVLGTITTSDANSIFDGVPSVAGTILTYKLADSEGNIGKTGTITVPVDSSTNYNGFSLTITVTVTEVLTPDLSVNPISVIYTGSPVPDTSITGTATVDGKSIAGKWSFASGQAITNVADSGIKQVIFTPDDKGNYGISHGTVSVTISKASPHLTLTPSSDVLPNGGTVTLTLSGLPTGGSASVTCSDQSISVTAGAGDTWTATIPSGGASYTFTATYGGDGNHNGATATCTVSVEKATLDLSLKASPETLKGGGAVTLTLSGLPAGETASVTCSDQSISVTAGAGNTWTATLPNSNGTYTFTASYAGSAAYKPASATCTVKTSEVVILDPPVGDDTTQFQLTMETGISEVPAGLKGIETLNTPEKLETAMKTAITQANTGIPQERTSVYDVQLLVSTDGGSTWIPATKDNFPSGGLTITLPYPDGTDSSYRFTVVHMFTTSDFGKKPGDTEVFTPNQVKNTTQGIQFVVTGLSPISVGWEKTSSPSNPSGGGYEDSGYAITVKKSEHGKVTSSRVNADSRDTVTLTVTPDSGYVLDTLTVTDSRGNELTLTAKGDGKYTFTMPSRAVTVKATFVPLPPDTEQPCDGGADCPSHGFTDLGTVGTWYHEAVDYVLQNGLMNGYGGGLFGPNENLSRAQLAQILYNYAGRPIITGANPFTDVANGEWYTAAITWAAAQGVVGGYGNGLFGPNDNITREQLAVMLWRYAGSPAATNKELHFNDIDEAGDYALEALRWAIENGILNGYGDGRLNPAGLATRAQSAAMLMRYMKDTQK